MNSPTPPFIEPARKALPSLGEELARSEGPHHVEVMRSSPPEEVLEQMAHADAIHTRLRERGLQVGFALSADSASLQIELRDSAGRLLRTLSAGEAVAFATGRQPE